MGRLSDGLVLLHVSDITKQSGKSEYHHTCLEQKEKKDG